MSDDPMLDAVLGYVDEHDFEMLAAPTTGEKKPIELGGKDFENATNDKAVLTEKWTKYPNSNIMRRVSGKRPTIVLDIETAEGHPKAAEKARREGKKFGLEALRELEGVYGRLPKTLLYSTWSGGLQVTYVRPAGDLQFKTGEIAPGVELKHNGIVMLPPSVRYGNAYAMLDDVAIVELPEKWIQFCTTELRDGLSEQEWDALKRRTSTNGPSFCEKHGIGMADVMPEIRTGRRAGDNGILLKHPVHGADGDGNLSVSIAKNLWHCFRCHSPGQGGDPITWIAVREGFIDCGDAGPLDKETFKRCKNVAVRDGLAPDESDRGGLNVETRSAMARGDGSNDKEIVSPSKLKYSDELFEELCDRKEHKDGSVTERPLPGKIASYLLEKCRFITFEDTDEVTYYDPDPESGLYRKEGEKQIGNAMERLIGDPLSSRHVSEAVDHIRRRTRRPRDDCIAKPTLIPTRDGVYDLTTETMTPYSPDVPFFSKHDFSYDMAVLERDTRAKRLVYSSFAREDIVPILEMGGRCLYRAPLYKKAFMLIGDGDNGKSIFLTWLTKTIGSENVCSLSLYQLIKSRFGTAQLLGENANIYADIGGGDLVYVGMFMAVTGGDAIDAEHKGMPLFRFVPYAALIFSTNKLPNVKEPPDQFYKRWILIEMPYTFVDTPKEPYERQRDASFELDDPSDEDKSWLGTACIEALKMLVKNGHFTESESGKNVKERWITKTDSLQAFVNAMVVESPGSRVTKKEFIETYQEWCGEVAMSAYSDRYIGLHLPRYVHTRTVHTSPRSWSNISVKGLNPLEMPNAVEMENADLMSYDLSNEGVDDD